MKKGKQTPRAEKLRNHAILANTVNRLLKQHHPGWSRDKLLCNPDAAKALCVTIRIGLDFAGNYSDEIILWTYLNFSKRSRLANGSGICRRKHR